MKIICIINQKGGVCKTTSTVNLAYYFQQQGKKVLLIDANEQSNLSETFIKEEIPANATLYAALKGEKVTPIKIHQKLDIIPSTEDISGLDSYILTDPKAKLTPTTLLRKLLKTFDEHYDFCFIDCPAQTALITANSIAASDYVLVPVKTSQYSWDGLNKCVDYVLEIKESLNPNLVLLGIFLTFYQSRLNSSKATLEFLQSIGCDEFLMKSTIRQSQDIVNIEKKGSIFEYNPKSGVAQDFEALGKEVLSRIKKVSNSK